jgi:hypothetical protein
MPGSGKQMLTNCAQAAITFAFLRKQSILIIAETVFHGRNNRRQDGISCGLSTAPPVPRAELTIRLDAPVKASLS